MKSPRHLILTVVATVLTSVGSSHAAVLWTTTFSGTVNTDNTSRTITNTPAGSFTDALATTTSALTRSSTGGNFFLTGTGNTFANYNPNQNVDNVANTAGWNAIFDFGPGTQTIDLSDVTFNIYRFNSSGATQATDANVRNVNISAEYSLNGGGTWTALAATKLVNLTTSNTTTGVNIALNYAPGAPVTVNLASDDFQIRYTVLNDAATSGAYNGISSIVFNGSVVPEPSAALLGGLGLLGLLRRRRA